MSHYSGRQLRQYRLNRVIGTGGFADVYDAVDTNLRRRVAIKLLHTKLAQEAIDAFLEEARIVARMEHPHIIHVIEFDCHENVPYLVMSYAPNGSVRQFYSRGAILPLETIVRYVEQAADALEYIHLQNVVHLDIKPENMLLGRDGEILLTDFGIATFVHASPAALSQDGVGTATYMAPERFYGAVSPASDQYSLAVCVYEWLTGTPPFQGSAPEIVWQHLHAEPLPINESNADTPLAVEHVVFKALNKNAEDRFTSVKEFAMALEKASHTPSPSKVEQMMNRKRHMWRETLLFFVMSIVTSTLLGIGLTLIGVMLDVAVPVAEVCLLTIPIVSGFTWRNSVAQKLSFGILAVALTLGLALQSWIAFGWTATILFIVFSYLSFIRAYHF